MPDCPHTSQSRMLLMCWICIFLINVEKRRAVAMSCCNFLHCLNCKCFVPHLSCYVLHHSKNKKKKKMKKQRHNFFALSNQSYKADLARLWWQLISIHFLIPYFTTVINYFDSTNCFTIMMFTGACVTQWQPKCAFSPLMTNPR